MHFAIRDGGVSDVPFLREMLYEAAFWRPETARPPINEGLTRPEFAKLLRGWGRTGDIAVVAAIPGGERIGAAWYRFWSEDEHSFGFVDPEIPELGMAVVRAYRRKGVGNALLSAITGRATKGGVGGISLSVEKDNPARYLYERHGFRRVDSLGNAWTMVRRTAHNHALQPPPAKQRSAQ